MNLLTCLKRRQRNNWLRQWRADNWERSKELRQKWESRHPEKIAKYRATTRDRWRGTPRQLLARAQARARRYSIEFNLTEQDINIPEYCPALGIRFTTKSVRGGHDASPSLDRLIPELGYVPGNVRVISKRANKIKTDATLEEIRAVCSWLEAELKK